MRNSRPQETWPSNFANASGDTLHGARSAQKIFAVGRMPGSASKVPLGTTQKRPFLLSFGTGEPQFRQNHLGNPGLDFVSTKRWMKSSPLAHESDPSGKPRFAACTEPVDF